MIINVDDVKEVIKPDDERYDTLFQSLINRKQKVIENYIGYHLEAEDYTESYDGEDEDTLYLNELPINSIASITSSDNLLDSELYEFYSKEGFVRLVSGNIFPKGVQNIEVVYNAGYTSKTMPEDIKDACIQLVCAEFVFTQVMVHTISTDENPAEKKKELEADAYRILDLYKKPKV